MDSASLVKTSNIPAQRIRQAELIQQGRVKQVRERPDFLRTLLGNGDGIGQGVTGPSTEPRALLVDHLEADDHDGQSLRGTVVQFPGNASPLFVLQSEQTSRKRTKRFRHALS